MATDLHMDIELIVCPIVREEDGLAMSSRNTYLSATERSQAVILNKALREVREAFEKGEDNVEKLVRQITGKINEAPLASIDYVSIYAYPSLKTIETVNDKALAAVAVRFGTTRLIDNIILEK
jgi:pantoate--beta-alanine ligase